jgi:hypothetical protein
MSQTQVQINGISIKTILENLQITDVTGIYITYIATSSYSYFITDKDFSDNLKVNSELISDNSGQYFESIHSGNEMYLVIYDDENSFEVKPTSNESFTFQIPKFSDYPLTHGEIYTLTAGEETYTVPVTPDATPTLELTTYQVADTIPPALSTYPIARVEKAFANYDSDKIIDRRAYETLTADIEAKMTANGGIMPQFKSFADYAAYKNSLSARNYVANNP